MAFSPPNNIPRFDDSQRIYENVYWTSNQSGRGRAKGNALSRLFEANSLPMYKDKPYKYAASKRRIPLWRRKRILAIAIVGPIVLYIFFWYRNQASRWNWLGRPAKPIVDWGLRRESVREAFKSSWDGYERHAWGKDEYNPLTKSGRQMAPSGVGWIIVDALDTLMIMNLTTRLSHARAWVSNSLNYSQNYEVSSFEASSRILGGLLSAHYLSTEFPELAPQSDDDEGAPGEDLYIEMATDLADRLLGAFDSRSRIPLTSVNLESRKARTSPGASSTAHVAGMQLEYKYLAKLLGEHIFWDAVDIVAEVIDGNGVEDGLLPSLMDPDTGTFEGQMIGLGQGVHSYYQYLVKQYLQTSKQEKVYQELWHEALAGIVKHLIRFSQVSELSVVGERPNGLEGRFSPRLDHQTCSLPATIVLAISGGTRLSTSRKVNHLTVEEEGQLLLAKELMKTCWTMYKVTATGLAPNAVNLTLSETVSLEGTERIISSTIDHTGTSDASNNNWRTDFSLDNSNTQNLQGSEAVESLFYMWRITGDPAYREWGWEMFNSFMNYTATGNGAGFVGISNVNVLPPQHLDKMEGVWLSRTLKYFYLLFSPEDLLPLDSVVFSIGAHPFPRFKLQRGLKTGWKRKPRDLTGSFMTYGTKQAGVDEEKNERKQ